MPGHVPGIFRLGGNKRGHDGAHVCEVIPVKLRSPRFLDSMFQIYLPIAELSVNLLVMLGLGAAVGFLSGMFGVGGGFLLTPFLMFSGIPPSIAVATGANQIVATSVSGAMAQWRRGNIDFRMGSVLIVGGVAGALIGVFLLKILREAGQAGLIISLTYVVLLGVIGGLMLNESIGAIRRARAGKPASGGSPDSTTGSTACRSSCAFPARGSISAPSRRW